jgi:REP element-mobilizing transposase RayT
MDSTPYYHCISRCVRRAFLCGEDEATGKNFDHRKEWLVERMKFLASVFAVDICAYAVLSNHFHLVLHVGRELALAWSDDEVLERVCAVFKGSASELGELTAKDRSQALKRWRERLSDLSWFMRCLNEAIARRANQEDDCTGRFWEGRFKSQALLDEGALLTCMSYVDLNPVRAGLADKLEDSEFTSIRERLLETAGRGGRVSPKKMLPQAPLVPLHGESGAERGTGRGTVPVVLPMTFGDYVELLEHTGKAIRTDGKAGHLPDSACSALVRLGIDPTAFVATVRGYSGNFFTMVGHTHRIALERDRLGLQQIKGCRAIQRLYAAA